MRLALWHEAFSARGPGLLLRDLERADERLVRLAGHLKQSGADVIVLTKFDYDAGGAALTALVELIGEFAYPYRLSLKSNAGIPTGQDLDADGRLGEPEDAQAYGRYPGQGGIAILSKFAIVDGDVRSYNDLLWQDLPNMLMTDQDTGRDIQRLSSGGHWRVPLELPDGTVLTVLSGHSNTPVFDGPDDRNGRRNRDELRLWEQMLDTEQLAPFVVMANTNLDPNGGEGYRDAMAAFLNRTDLQDPLSGIPTAHWERPGPLRVSYILPSSEIEVTHAEVLPLLPDTTHNLILMTIQTADTPLP